MSKHVETTRAGAQLYLGLAVGCWLALSVWGWGLPRAQAQAVMVTRGPYLQKGSPHSLTVRWRTDAVNLGRVRYGLTQANLNSFADETTATAEHSVALSNLQADTTYFYSVGTAASALAGGDANHFFVTPPLAGAAKNTRIWVLGDAGTATANQTAVRDAYAAFNGARYTDLWLMLGDNAYPAGSDSEYQAAVFNIYPNTLRQSVLWSTIGNHDTAQSANPPATLPYYQIFDLPQNAEAGGLASGTEDYYSFDYGNIHFVCLDSMTSARTAGSPMLVWLQNDLAANNKTWLIAFWHHPPYTKGSHDSDNETELIEMRQNALPILESYGVDLVLTGHSHVYERSYLIDGHYGLSNTFANSMKKNGGDGRIGGNGAYQKPTLGPGGHEGAVYVVTGSAGQATGGALNHPAMFISLNNLGSLVVDVNGAQLNASFVRETGATADSFTLVKGNVPPTVSLTSPTNGATFTAPATITLNANATDSGGAIAKVDFYQGATLIGTDTMAPYQFTWNNVTPGIYALTAKATDNLNAVTISNTASVTVNGASATFVTVGANWKYLDNGSDQGSAWRATGFNDAAWASGAAELGYGDGDEATVIGYGPDANNKYITTYFRRAFTVANPASYGQLLLRVKRDDGAAVYLNGNEVFRDNLPSGALGYTTLASAGAADDGATFLQTILSAGLLQSGTNVVAVEIHQNLPTSSDVSFDLELATAPGIGDPAGDVDNDGIPNGVELIEGTHPLVKDNNIFANSPSGYRLFVMQQYRDFLGREGDAGGITGWVALLQNGTLTRAQVIQSFFNSPEFQQYGAPIVRLYFAYFRRIPDYAGQLFWTNQLRGGTSLEAISQVFATSPEFVLTYGSLNNSQFITLVYQNVLNRTPSQAEVNAWVALLNQGAPRGQVMAGFSESPEFKQQSANKVFVVMMYVGLLRRAPEQAGFNGWLALLNGGTSQLVMTQSFLDAPEYHQRFLP